MPELGDTWGNADNQADSRCDGCEQLEEINRRLVSALRLAGHAVSVGLDEADAAIAAVASGEVVDLY